jgi:glycerol-3-phosphate dehydrogenase (NAD(P)+)
MKIVVLGAGAWGSALAYQAAHTHATTLWARDASQIDHMRKSGVNDKYLSAIPCPTELSLSSQPMGEWLHEFDLIVIATPMSALRGMLTQLAHLKVRSPVVWLCKGFEAPLTQHLISAEHLRSTTAPSAGLLAHEVMAEVAPGLMGGVLSGPSFAQEVAGLQPSALVGASVHALVRETLVGAFHSDKLRVYSSSDIIGVEVGGAVKNVMAIATGLCDGLALGLNARAALITRGLFEMTALGVALGAKAQTFMGLSGLGDLVLTTTGDLSRNRKVGLCLAKGMTLTQTLESLGHVAEGVYSAKTVMLRAQKLGVEMPITHAVVDLLQGRLEPTQAIQRLMARSAKEEALNL